MPERIGVTYASVMFEGRHLALFYENNNGGRVVIDAWGANKDNLTFSQKAGGTIQDAWQMTSRNWGSPWSLMLRLFRFLFPVPDSHRFGSRCLDGVTPTPQLGLEVAEASILERRPQTRAVAWDRGLTHKRVLRVALALIAISATALIDDCTATEQPFNPVRRVPTWYTDRGLVYIEIVGSTSTLEDLHKLEPDGVLRFRLERAYVSHLSAERGPGFQSVHFGIDIETQLPDALILARNQPAQFREEIPGVPKLSLQELTPRRLDIGLRSTRSAVELKRASRVLEACKGVARNEQLADYAWEGRQGCRRPNYRNGSRHIAVHDDGMLSLVECQAEDFPGLGCALRFPFEGFAVEVTFHQSRLLKWSNVMESARTFLMSKRHQ